MILGIGYTISMRLTPPPSEDERLSELINQIQPEAAYRNFQKLKSEADAGDPKAKAILVGEFARGDIVTADIQQACDLAKDAARGGHPIALYFHQNLVDLGLLDKPFLTQNSETEWVEILKRCEASDTQPEVQEILIRMNNKGLGMDKPNEDLAYLYCIAATNRDLPQAWVRRGYFHEHGVGQAEWNEDLAFECYLRAAKLGSADGAHHLARCYIEGVGTKKNYEIGLGYLARAAQKKGGKPQQQLTQILASGVDSFLLSQKTNTGFSFGVESPYEFSIGDQVTISRELTQGSIIGEIADRKNGKYLISVKQLLGVSSVPACASSGQIEIDAGTQPDIWVPQYCID